MRSLQDAKAQIEYYDGQATYRPYGHQVPILQEKRHQYLDPRNHQLHARL